MAPRAQRGTAPAPRAFSCRWGGLCSCERLHFFLPLQRTALFSVAVECGNYFVSIFPKSDAFLTNSYANDFTVFCSDSNIDQIVEAFSVHSSNIEEWADERGSAILLTSLYSPLNSHNLRPILKSLWTTPYYPWKGLQVYWEGPSILTSNSMPMSNLYSPGLCPESTPSRSLLVPTEVSKRKPYLSPLYPLSGPFSCMQLISLIQKLLSIENSALRIATGCVKMSSMYQVHEETKILPVQDPLSLISSQIPITYNQ